MIENSGELLKKLSVGLSAWIQYERCCKRTEVLSESYLSYPISQILNSHSNLRVVSEFTHPVLEEERLTKSGRKPALDYVLCNHNGQAELAIEVKWVGKSGLTAKSVIWDLIRLELNP